MTQRAVSIIRLHIRVSFDYPGAVGKAVHLRPTYNEFRRTASRRRHTMAQRDDRKRLGKKHRDASTRPKKGRAPRVTPTTGAVDPRKRKVLASKKASLEKKKRTPPRSPENESRRTIAPKPRPTDNIVG